MPNYSKRKGKRLEEYVAEKFNQIHGGIVAHRAVSSGSFTYEAGSDIYFIKKDIPLVIECKNQESWKYRTLFDAEFHNRSPFKTWLNQLYQSANKYKLIYNREPVPLLVFSKAYEPVFCIIEKRYITEITYPFLANEVYYIILLDTFLELYKSKKIAVP